MFEVLACVVVTTSLGIVMCKTKKIRLRTNNGKFRNPIKNINCVIILGIASFAILQLILFHLPQVPLLVFPRFPCGLCMTPMLTAFLLTNPEARLHACRRLALADSRAAREGVHHSQYAGKLDISKVSKGSKKRVRFLDESSLSETVQDNPDSSEDMDARKAVIWSVPGSRGPHQTREAWGLISVVNLDRE